MAFKDITKVLYDGKVKIDYKDKAHRYYARMRVDWNLPESDPKAWGKIMYPKGTTTLIGDTLEKKGLQQWPKNVALRELFGFYSKFTKDDGTEQPAGFSKGVGTLWEKNTQTGENMPWLTRATKEELLPLIDSAAKGWQRKQKKGADIGSVVHDAIEHFVTEQPFDIGEQYMWNIKEAEYESEELRELALKEFDMDVAQATNAFLQFQLWWEAQAPKLLGAEDLLYSLKHNICGTYDGLIEWQGKRVLCDWKTSNTYGDAPEGVSYDYFIQSAIYAMAYMEMHSTVRQLGNGITETSYSKEHNIDDLLIVSARKDGGFAPVLASEIGLTVPDAIKWAESVIVCHEMRKSTMAGLLKHAEENPTVPLVPKIGKLNNKEAF